MASLRPRSGEVQYILITEREAQLGVSGSDIVAGGSVELASVKSVPVAARALYFVAAMPGQR